MLPNKQPTEEAFEKTSEKQRPGALPHFLQKNIHFSRWTPRQALLILDLKNIYVICSYLVITKVPL
jgi:hypothetical protein